MSRPIYFEFGIRHQAVGVKSEKWGVKSRESGVRGQRLESLFGFCTYDNV